jgi:hypothetical protein
MGIMIVALVLGLSLGLALVLGLGSKRELRYLKL